MGIANWAQQAALEKKPIPRQVALKMEMDRTGKQAKREQALVISAVIQK